MRAARVAIAVALVLGAFAVTPAKAANSCEVVATGLPATPGDCRYVATSAKGTYQVVTLSGFIISASSDGGAHFRTLVSRVARPGDNTGGIASQSGEFTVNVGDIVVAAIAHAIVTGPNGTTRIQDGRITAADG